MNIRNYNIYFNTHTISGIIACGLLYVIFFAGSFAFFRDEIALWQKGASYAEQSLANDRFDRLLDSLREDGFELQGRDMTFYLEQQGRSAYVNIAPSNDTSLRETSEARYFTYNFVQKNAGKYAEHYDMAEFLFRLHFLAPLNEVPLRLGIAPFGYMLAGIVSFLFLFALISGLLLHWNKIVSNFFTFRPFSKWKTVWTDIHTALGVIGYPFQLLYAVTGIFLILNSVLTIPFEKILYQGDAAKMYEELGYTPKLDYPYSYQPLKQHVHLESYLDLHHQKWPDSKLKRIFIKNYGDANMHVLLETEPDFEQSFAGAGLLTVRVKDGQIIEEKAPVTSQATYVDQVRALIYRLHYGDFGGYPVKAIYFILGIMGCLVITSGILIWLVARDKNKVAPHKRKFNRWMANFFMAACLSMLPVTALTFIAVKLGPNVNQHFIYSVYFYSWLVFTLYYTLRRDIRRTNRETLLVGSILAFCIPLVNGWISGDWLWKTLLEKQTAVFIIDFLWLLIGLIALTCFLKTRRFFAAQQAA